MRLMTNIQIICKLQSKLLKSQGGMKKIMVLLFCALICNSCVNDERRYNDKLPDFNIGQIEVNKNMPQWIDLNNINGFVIVPDVGVGSRGILVVCINPGRNEYLAFDLATPHLTLKECAAAMRYDVSTNFNCISQCDGKEIEYNIYDPRTEVDGLIYTMRQYVAIGDGQRVVITN